MEGIVSKVSIFHILLGIALLVMSSLVIYDTVILQMQIHEKETIELKRVHAVQRKSENSKEIIEKMPILKRVKRRAQCSRKECRRLFKFCESKRHSEKCKDFKSKTSCSTRDCPILKSIENLHSKISFIFDNLQQFRERSKKYENHLPLNTTQLMLFNPIPLKSDEDYHCRSLETGASLYSKEPYCQIKDNRGFWETVIRNWTVETSKHANNTQIGEFNITSGDLKIKKLGYYWIHAQITFFNDVNRNGFKINKISEVKKVQTLSTCINTAGLNKVTYSEITDNEKTKKIDSMEETEKRKKYQEKFKYDNKIYKLALEEQYTSCSTSVVTYLNKGDKIFLSTFYPKNKIAVENRTSFWRLIKLG
ncbi:DgyrCDS2137 [Dimorphilus gyrociliatus]|uniref:DgyrCDS2137 n=1 Tax=Dimorphilus gyrociliatus TaxID=2664684 RepID=A0A7I8VCF3_9ANNE|nr:DgyrCDS2137 [Dimorphilus gyrociliatus]